ncbi:MAG: PqqD family protein [Bacteroidaceae bacterium]|nr:PqqD family protein [Bacteroidaceae bacterium]MBQ1178166.1 PqqD family protein [Bacteroidaceae bacterium]MBR5847719.1 PqqD family protein [Bacteroidaceae bacterium]
MKINKGFELREMCGEHIIIGTGVENIDFSKVISLNESAAWLWREVEGKEFTPQSLAALLMEQYDVDEATALADATALAAQWVSVGIVAE